MAMQPHLPLWSLVGLILVIASCQVSGLSNHPIVIVLGFDGLRYDYIDRGFTPTLAKLAKEGVSTDYLQNVFPTKTMTNFFSIATGMYAETHGVLGNYVFNADLQCLSYGEELFRYNNDITPIWTLNELTGSGRHSGSMMWTSNEFEFRGLKPTFYEAFDKNVSWHKRITTSLEWLLHPTTPINLLFMYFEQPDSAGHNFGTDSIELDEQLRRVDAILSFLLEHLASHHIEDKVNIIVLSDHGMINVDRNHLINVTDAISNLSNKTKTCNSSPLMQIASQPEIRQQLYNKLTALQNQSKMFDMYKLEDIPERWNFKNNKRNTDLLLVAKLPYAFDDETNIGEHGYDNEEKLMHAFFAAKGPHFRTNHHMRSINNTDIYALISYILALDPSKLIVKPNSTLSEIINTLYGDIVQDFKTPAKRHLLEYFIPKSDEVPSLQFLNKASKK